MAHTLPDSAESLTQMADEIFELTKMAWRQRLAARAADTETELSESKFLTLDSLIRQDKQTVGELQRYLGVIPAQMSRIIRSLEGGFPRPLIACALNPEDKRKIDVTLTAAGRPATRPCLRARASSIHIFLMACIYAPTSPVAWRGVRARS